MSNQHPIIKALQEELAKERNDEMTAFEFCTGPVGYRIGHDSASARLLPLIEKAVEMAGWIENQYGDEIVLTHTEYNHKSAMTYRKAKELLTTLADASGEMNRESK